jgi:hypothetical protein
MAEKHGDKLTKRLEESGRLEETRGPLARMAQLKRLWKLTEDKPTPSNKAPHQMMGEFNRMLEEVFPAKAKDPSAERIHSWLKMTPESRSFSWLSHAFHARQYYLQTTIGRLCRNIHQAGNRLPFKILQAIARIPELVTMGATLIFRQERIRQLARL